MKLSRLNTVRFYTKVLKQSFEVNIPASCVNGESCQTSERRLKMLQVYIVFGVRSKNDVCKLNFTCSTLYISRHTGYGYRVSQELSSTLKIQQQIFVWK